MAGLGNLREGINFLRMNPEVAAHLTKKRFCYMMRIGYLAYAMSPITSLRTGVAPPYAETGITTET